MSRSKRNSKILKQSNHSNLYNCNIKLNQAHSRSKIVRNNYSK